MKHLAPKAYQCEHCGTVLKTEAGAIKHEEKCPKNNVAKMEKVKLQSEFSKELQEIRETSVSIHEVVLRVVELWRKFGVNVNFNSYPSVFSMQVRNTHDSPKGYPRNWESKPGLPKGYPGWQGRWIGTIEIVDPKKLGNHYAYFQDLCGVWGQCGNLEGVTFFKIGCDGGCGGGGGENDFSYSGMMFLYDFPKMHKEFIDNGEEYKVLESEYNTSISDYKKVFLELCREHVEKNPEYVKLSATIEEMKKSIIELEHAKSKFADSIRQKFTENYDVPIPTPTSIFVNDGVVMSTVCNTQRKGAKVHPKMDELMDYMGSLALKIKTYKDDNPELFI
jgi:hypothetical protein